MSYSLGKRLIGLNLSDLPRPWRMFCFHYIHCRQWECECNHRWISCIVKHVILHFAEVAREGSPTIELSPGYGLFFPTSNVLLLQSQWQFYFH